MYIYIYGALDSHLAVECQGARRFAVGHRQPKRVCAHLPTPTHFRDTLETHTHTLHQHTQKKRTGSHLATLAHFRDTLWKHRPFSNTDWTHTPFTNTHCSHVCESGSHLDSHTSSVTQTTQSRNLTTEKSK